MNTSSRGTRTLGVLSLAGAVFLGLFGLWWSPEDTEMGDVVRIMYVHVPAAWIAYLAFIVTAVASACYLRRRTVWWDLVAGSSAEIGVMFCALALVTGAIWGRPTWGTYWEWGDARIVTTTVLLLLYVGYLALRRTGGDGAATRAAVIGLFSALMIPIVHMSVRWWADRTLHQEGSVLNPELDPAMEGMHLFTLMFGVVVFSVGYGWLLLHRFRVAWLEAELETHGLVDALAARRAEGAATVDRAIGATS